MAALLSSLFNFGKGRRGSRDKGSGASSLSSSGEVDGPAAQSTQSQEHVARGSAGATQGTDPVHTTPSEKRRRVQPPSAATWQPAGGDGAADLPPVKLKINVGQAQQAGGGDPTLLPREPSSKGDGQRVASAVDPASLVSIGPLVGYRNGCDVYLTAVHGLSGRVRAHYFKFLELPWAGRGNDDMFVFLDSIMLAIATVYTTYQIKCHLLVCPLKISCCRPCNSQLHVTEGVQFRDLLYWICRKQNTGGRKRGTTAKVWVGPLANGRYRYALVSNE